MKPLRRIPAVLFLVWLISSSAPRTYADSFEETVDLNRYRKGNPDWDTQELIASGLKALHEDHQKILKELEELKTEIRNSKERTP